MIIQKQVTFIYDDAIHKLELKIVGGDHPHVVDVNALPDEDYGVEVYASSLLALQARVQKNLVSIFMDSSRITFIQDAPFEREFHFMSGDTVAFSLSVSEIKLLGERVWRHFSSAHRDIEKVMTDLNEAAYPKGEELGWGR